MVILNIVFLLSICVCNIHGNAYYWRAFPNYVAPVRIQQLPVLPCTITTSLNCTNQEGVTSTDKNSNVNLPEGSNSELGKIIDKNDKSSIPEIGGNAESKKKPDNKPKSAQLSNIPTVENSGSKLKDILNGETTEKPKESEKKEQVKSGKMMNGAGVTKNTMYGAFKGFPPTQSTNRYPKSYRVGYYNTYPNNVINRYTSYIPYTFPIKTQQYVSIVPLRSYPIVVRGTSLPYRSFLKSVPQVVLNGVPSVIRPNQVLPLISKGNSVINQYRIAPVQYTYWK